MPIDPSFSVGGPEWQLGSVEAPAQQSQGGDFGAMRADGSTVDMDSEQAKLAANALDQQAAVQVASSRIQILKIAIGGGA